MSNLDSEPRWRQVQDPSGVVAWFGPPEADWRPTDRLLVSIYRHRGDIINPHTPEEK